MTLAQEIAHFRARNRAQTRNERVRRSSLEYREGYAAAYADYIAFREPVDQLEDLAGVHERYVAGYRAGYADAKRGAPSRWPNTQAES